MKIKMLKNYWWIIFKNVLLFICIEFIDHGFLPKYYLFSKLNEYKYNYFERLPVCHMNFKVLLLHVYVNYNNAFSGGIYIYIY